MISSFSLDCGVGRNKMYSFAHTIDNIHDCIIPIGVG
jgi:hypothetical protein